MGTKISSKTTELKRTAKLSDAVSQLNTGTEKKQADIEPGTEEKKDKRKEKEKKRQEKRDAKKYKPVKAPKQKRQKKIHNSAKDTIYDNSDVLVALGILVLAAAVICWRMCALMTYGA